MTLTITSNRARYSIKLRTEPEHLRSAIDIATASSYEQNVFRMKTDSNLALTWCYLACSALSACATPARMHDEAQLNQVALGCGLTSAS